MAWATLKHVTLLASSDIDRPQIAGALVVLAVGVRSPTNTAADLDAKRAWAQAAGVDFWLVEPGTSPLDLLGAIQTFPYGGGKIQPPTTI